MFNHVSSIILSLSTLRSGLNTLPTAYTGFYKDLV